MEAEVRISRPNNNITIMRKKKFKSKNGFIILLRLFLFLFSIKNIFFIQEHTF